MSQSADTEKPLNEQLEKLAQSAEMEDNQPEETSKAEEQAQEEQQQQQQVQNDTGEKAAKAIVNGLTMAVKSLLKIEYDDETKQKLIEAYTPVLQSEGAIPSPVLNFAARYGIYFAAVGVTGFIGFQTYTTYKAMKEAEEKAKQPQTEAQPEEPQYTPAEPMQATGATSGAGFQTDGA